jgi:hypothetical protein
MHTRRFRWTALALSCLLIVACKDKHEPLKPTVMQPVFSALSPAR